MGNFLEDNIDHKKDTKWKVRRKLEQSGNLGWTISSASAAAKTKLLLASHQELPKKFGLTEYKHANSQRSVPRVG